MSNIFLGEFKARTDWNIGSATITDGGTPVDLTAEGVTVACQLRPHEFDQSAIDVDLDLSDGENGVAGLSVGHESTDVSPGNRVGDIVVWAADGSRKTSRTFEITVLAAVTVVAEEEAP